MARADRVLSTPPTNTSSPYPCLPPAVGISREHKYCATTEASHDRHTLAHLVRLREEAAAEVERLLAFLDAKDGCEDLEPYLTGYSDGMDDRGGECEDEGAQCDDEGDRSDSGIADLEGYMEQCPSLFDGCDVRVDA